jgi:hypothetical protein
MNDEKPEIPNAALAFKKTIEGIHYCETFMPIKLLIFEGLIIRS